jgi:hypothetical protein
MLATWMKGVMLPSHGNVLKVLGMGSDVDVLICFLPLGGAEGDAQPNYIAVCLPWDKCNEVVCGDKASVVGMVFDDDKFPNSEEKLMGFSEQLTCSVNSNFQT